MNLFADLSYRVLRSPWRSGVPFFEVAHKIESRAVFSKREIMTENIGGRRREPDRAQLPPSELKQAELAQPLPNQNQADRSSPDFGPVDYPGRPNERDAEKVGERATANDPGRTTSS